MLNLGVCLRFFQKAANKQTLFQPINLKRLENSYFTGKCIVDQVIHPNQEGKVRLSGSWWPAACPQALSLHPGQAVRVIGRRNLTLFVEPI